MITNLAVPDLALMLDGRTAVDGAPAVAQGR
jgi:hypothetical protein